MKVSLKSAFALLTALCCLLALVALPLQPQRYPDMYIAKGGVASSYGPYGYSFIARGVELQKAVDHITAKQDVEVVVPEEFARTEVEFFRGDGDTAIEVLQDLCSGFDLKVTQTAVKRYQIERR